MEKEKIWQSITIKQIKKKTKIVHMRQDACLVFVLSGKAFIEYNECIESFEVGEFFVVPNFSSIQITPDGLDSRVYQFQFKYSIDMDLTQKAIFSGDSKSKGEASHSTLTLAIGRLLKLYYIKREEATYWEVNALYFQIISKLEQKYQVFISKEKEELSEDYLGSYVEQHLSDETLIEDTARQFYISKQTLNRYFKKHFGKSVSKYIQDKRFERLEGQLASTNLPINELVYNLGFKNINSFNRLFKAKYGISPIQWREENHRINPQRVVNNEKLEVEDFQQLLKKSEYHYSLDTQKYRIRNNDKHIWTIEKPTTLISNHINGTLNQIVKLIHISTIRIPFRIEEYDEWQYKEVLTILSAYDINPCFIINLSTVDHLKHQVESLYHLSHLLSTSLFLEITIDFNNSDWMLMLTRLIEKMKHALCCCVFGIGGLRFSQNQQRITELLQQDIIKEYIDFLAISLLPEINPDSHYSRHEQIVKYSTLDVIYQQFDDFVSFLKTTSPHKDIYLAEYNLTANFQDEINDDIYQADYHVAFLEAFSHLVDQIGPYSLFDECKSPLQEFSGLPGAVSVSGLPKAQLYAISFIEALYDQVLLSEHHFCATYDGKSNYRILAYYFYPIEDYYSSDNDIDLYSNQQNIFNIQNNKLQFTIHHMDNGLYRITYYILDQENGSGPIVQRHYTGLKNIDMKMKDFLATQYRPRLFQKEVIVRDHQLIEKLYVKSFEISYVNIEKIDNLYD